MEFYLLFKNFLDLQREGIYNYWIIVPMNSCSPRILKDNTTIQSTWIVNELHDIFEQVLPVYSQV